jgi:hypothetical protein
MNLNPIKANMTELVLNDYRILFSYKTPVAMQDRRTKEFYQTNKKWSQTTTRHINQWVSDNLGFGAKYKPQEYFYNLIAEVK